MANRYPYNRDRSASGDRDAFERAGDEVRSWFGDDEAERRRRMDEQARGRWSADGSEDERWRTASRWGGERSYSSDREYGDRGYGWRGEHEHGSRVMNERDYGWRSEPSRGTAAGAYDRDAYGGQYAARRDVPREWSSTEGWRVPGPFVGRGPRGYQRSDDRIREEINDRLTAHGLIDATDIECRAANGEVTLTGFVDSRAAKRAAEDVAEDVHGVRQVHNQLRIRSSSPDHDGVGRTSVLGLTESQTQTPHTSAAAPAEPGRSRTR